MRLHAANHQFVYSVHLRLPDLLYDGTRRGRRFNPSQFRGALSMLNFIRWANKS